ncbi:hypothetical protein lbkm_1497 [Lachnospiraceae bacterium KM106-2]|nr:hypothetical protein lbkm_1497 [Lachnospiraceae bacterium KM106-2]
MSAPRKQHYVPQTYLKNFSTLTKSIDRIFTLHKDKRIIISTNVRDIATERNFYTIGNLEDKYIWENTYARVIEPLMRDVISNVTMLCKNVLIKNGSLILTQEMKEDLAISIMCQLLRGKQTRSYMSSLYSKKIPETIEESKDHFKLNRNKTQKLKDIIGKEDFFKKIAMDVVLNPEGLNRYINVLMNKRFILFKINGKEEFITSDNPVMFLNVITLNVKPFNNGIRDNKTAIFFPINPKLLLGIYDKSLWFDKLRRYDNRLAIIDDCKDKSFIETHNKKQYEQCFNQVYAKNRGVLENIIVQSDSLY